MCCQRACEEEEEEGRASESTEEKEEEEAEKERERRGRGRVQTMSFCSGGSAAVNFATPWKHTTNPGSILHPA